MTMWAQKIVRIGFNIVTHESARSLDEARSAQSGIKH